MERQRSHGILAGLKMQCKSAVYFPKHAEFHFVLTLFEKDISSASCFVAFVLRKVGKEYSHYAEVAKKCKKRNGEIYRKVMVCRYSMM